MVHRRTGWGRNRTTFPREGPRKARLDPFHQSRPTWRRLQYFRRGSIEFQDQRTITRQQELRCGIRNPTHLKVDAILESPSLFLIPQSKSAVDDLVELNEGLKELWVGFGVAEVVTEEGSELFEAVQTAPGDHVKQFFGGECDGCRLNGTRPMAQRADQRWKNRHCLAYVAKTWQELVTY